MSGNLVDVNGKEVISTERFITQQKEVNIKVAQNIVGTINTMGKMHDKIVELDKIICMMQDAQYGKGVRLDPADYKAPGSEVKGG